MVHCTVFELSEWTAADKIKSKAAPFTLAGLATFERQEGTGRLKPGGVRQVTLQASPFQHAGDTAKHIPPHLLER